MADGVGDRAGIEPNLSRATRLVLISWAVWTGCALVALMRNSSQYAACMQGDAWMCFDLTVPILALWAFLSIAGWGIFGIDRALRRFVRRRS
jgi:hypothetical protein